MKTIDGENPTLYLVDDIFLCDGHGLCCKFWVLGYQVQKRPETRVDGGEGLVIFDQHASFVELFTSCA